MVLCDLHSQAPKSRTKGKNSLVLQKSIIFAANIFAIAAKNIGFFGAAVLDVPGELLLAIPNKLRYHLPTHARELSPNGKKESSRMAMIFALTPLNCCCCTRAPVFRPFFPESFRSFMQ
jgi:hypothetical protein